MLRKKDKYVVALVGATGVVGKEMLEVLEERNFPVDELRAFASERSEGERAEFRSKSIVVRRPASDSFKGVDIAFFTAGTEPGLEFAPVAAQSGTVVIDTSAAFRMDPKAPLVLPEVNLHALEGHHGIIASPGSPAIGLAMVAAPIKRKAGIKRIVVTAFHPVCGAGKKGMDELAQQTVSLLNFRDVETKIYPHQIAFNCIPQVGPFAGNGHSQEETMLVNETRKLLEDNSLQIAATSVLVPVFRGLALAVNVEMGQALAVNDVRALLAEIPGVLVYDDPGKSLYPLAADCVGKNEVWAGRIREDHSLAHGVSLWIAFDNLRKGAALNAVQIAEELIK